MMDISNATTTPTNTHINDSYIIRSKAAMREYLSTLRELYGPEMAVSKRNLESQLREWRSHNLFYHIHIFRSRTKDVDLELHQTWWRELFCRVVDFLYFW